MSDLLVFVVVLMSFHPEVNGLIRYPNGTWSVCATSPELYALHTTSCIKGGMDTIHHKFSSWPCSSRTWNERRYRTYNGTCNAQDDRGSAMSGVKRLMTPVYQGAHSGPRIMSTTSPNSPLPSARVVSKAVHRPNGRKSQFTLLLMQVGQLLDHDMTAVPVPTEKDKSIRCCNGSNVASESHRECFPIEIPAGDPVFGRCMEFVRSDPLMFPNGTEPQPRVHVNSLTSFIDASMVYGSNEERAKALRTRDGKGALLNTRQFNGQDRLPAGHADECTNQNTSHFCALAGDDRVNEQPGLTALHTVFHLEHNRLVRKLVRAVMRNRGRYSKWTVNKYLRRASDNVHEILYQEVRKVLGAVWQNIVYSEYLPLIIGSDFMARYNLTTGQRVAFVSSVDPSVSAEFVTAAFRFGHTLVSEMMATDQLHHLRELFSVSAHNLENFPKIVKGLVAAGDTQAETYDPNMAESLVDHLFENTEARRPGLDLAAINIQRGRDHGLPSFNELREFLGLSKFNWTDFGDNAQALRRIYQHPDDVDLFTGGTSEDSVDGGVVGEVFARVLGQQFRDLKFGDRYYFETDSTFYGFGDGQLRTIRKLCLNKILCENADMKFIQRNPFKPPYKRTNPMLRCADLPDINMKLFRKDVVSKRRTGRSPW